MAVYGITLYGSQPTEGYYGFSFPPDYRVDPFNATSVDYSTVYLSWQKPAGTILAYRLIRNSFGYPVDQDDGDILIDSLNYPGSFFKDKTVKQGQYYYYGFYVLLNFEGNVWVRSGLTACLAIADHSTTQWLLNLMPGYFTNAATDGDELTADVVGNTFLEKFTSIVGWGMDLLRTQYDTYKNINNPWKIPLTDLYALSQELGININPDIHPYTLRKAIFFNAEINKKRGTVTGIETEVSALTGWNSDLQIGNNIMLENDQSNFSHPVYPVWFNNTTYNVGERVTYGTNYWYQCIATGNRGNAPTGTSASNTWWQAIINTNDTVDLANSTTGGINTWEVLYPGVTNGTPSANSLQQTLGVPSPDNSAFFRYASLRAINQGASTQDIWLRSVSRTSAEATTVASPFAPDIYQAIADGIPVPFSLPNIDWDATKFYRTDDIVTYSGQPFIALRASKGSQPPYGSGTSADWEALSPEPRYPICVSTYATGSSSVQITPFVEWYDNKGNYITRVFARNPSPGTAAPPDKLAFDSFCNKANTNLNARTTDDGQFTWVQQAGTFRLSPLGSGSIFPLVVGQRTYATINAGVSDTQVGVTFLTEPEAGQTQGLILRWSDDTHYIRAGYNNLRINNGGSWSVLGTYSTAFAGGDRMVVQLNGSSITVLRNGVSVLSTTSSFNQTATFFGPIVENT